MLEAKAMKINSTNNINYKGHGSIIKNIKRAAGNKFAQIGQIGEGVNIALDFAGKAVLVPATIMVASKEDKEKKEYSALKNPIAATIQLLMEVPILMAGSKFIENLANSGALDPDTGAKLYNENEAKKTFLYFVKKVSQSDEVFEENSKKLIENIEHKGLTRKIKEEFELLIRNASDNMSKKNLLAALNNYELTHKRLYHLQNRVCFIAAIALTPILCKIEDYFFPKIMNFITKNKTQKPQTKKIFTINHFKSQILKGGIK